MLCSRCGAEVNPKQRYCMKCGALNYDHPDNASLKKYITEEEIEKSNKEYHNEVTNTMQVEIAGQVYETKTSEKATYIDSRAGLVPVVSITVILGALCYFWFHLSIMVSLIISLIYFVSAFYMMATACVYMKGGYSGFTTIVPFYAQYAFFDIALGKGWYFLLTLIPIVGVFFALYANYKVGKAFGKSGWITLFFPFVMYPIIAFSDGVTYEGEGRQYKKFVASGKRRRVMICAVFYSILVFFAVFLPVKVFFMPIVQQMSFNENAKTLLSAVKKDIKDGNYMCDGVGAGKTPGTYYIVFDDASALSSLGTIKSSYNGNPISGYITISVDASLTSRFFITITDGTNGLYGVAEDSSETWIVRPLEKVEVPQNAIICEKS